MEGSPHNYLRKVLKSEYERMAKLMFTLVYCVGWRFSNSTRSRGAAIAVAVNKLSDRVESECGETSINHSNRCWPALATGKQTMWSTF
ncbi:hypothetical protein J6590_019627 [Homalodisca vitripennis]|nr:hypothetical protein J6590_019627 [Homalodisca vitripennis]